MFKKIIALIGAIMLLAATSAFAIDYYGGYPIPVDIAVNGSFLKCEQKPILVDGTTYLPLRAFADAIGGTILWDETTKAATMTKNEHTLVCYPVSGQCIIDGEESHISALLYQNLSFIPVRMVSEALCYQVTWDEFYLTVQIEAPDVTVPSECVDTSYTYEDMLYLGKITQIESGSQHFQVKLGVAGTVMNRVASSQFPNSVKEVIFDTRYGVQFPPAHTQKINLTPSKDTMIAAKCVLNGANVVKNSLYFVDTVYAPSSWVHNNRPYVITLYDMSFYE